MLSRRMPKANRVVHKHALVVRPAMMHLPHHLAHDAWRRFRIRTAYYSADSAHGLLCRLILEGTPASGMGILAMTVTGGAPVPL